MQAHAASHFEAQFIGPRAILAKPKGVLYWGKTWVGVLSERPTINLTTRERFGSHERK